MSESFIAIEIIILGGLSIIGCSFVVYCFAKFQQLRTDQLKIVIHIIIFDLIQQILLLSSAIGYLITKNDDCTLKSIPFLCYGQATLLQLSLIASTTWTTIIANNLYQTVKYGNSSYRRIAYSIVGYGFPLSMASLYCYFYKQLSRPYAFDAYGVSAIFSMSMCAFNSAKPQIRYFILVFQDIPIWSTFIYNALIFALVIWELYKNLGKNCIYGNKQIFLLFLYPFLVAICWGMPAIINQFKVDAQIWPIVAFGFGSLIGLLDSYLYCYMSLSKTVEFVGFKLKLKTQSLELSPLKK